MERPFPAYAGNEPYIFVCYSHEDSVEVYPEISRLRDAGFHIWYDEGITPGSEWSEILAKAINGCSVFLFFITPRGVVSEHCRREANFALEQPCGMLAVHLERTDLPDGLKLSLSNRQGILRYEYPQATYEAKLNKAVRQAAAGETPASVDSAALQIGDWTLDLSTHRLKRGGVEQPLDPKDISVLLHLVERAPELVTTEGLLARNWPGAVVGDNALHQVIGHLRKAFGDNARAPMYIETQPKRGYRLLVSVEQHPATPLEDTPASLRRRLYFRWRRVIRMGLVGAVLVGVGWWYWQTLPLSGDAREGASAPAIAVLPFTNIGDTEDYFSDGVTEEILNRMVLIRDVRVISRQSSFVYRDSELDIREIGEQLGADYILQGSVRRSANIVRIGVRLTDAAVETEIWSSTYDRELTDILRVQDEIAQVAISEFVPSITVAPSAKPDVDPTAYDLYLRGRRAWVAMDPFTAKTLLESAIAIDPDFAGAYGALSAVQILLRAWSTEFFVGDHELLRVVNRALELDPDNLDALSVEAILTLYLEYDMQGAIAKFESLIRRFPDSLVFYDQYHLVLAAALKTDEMLLVLERIRELDPHSTATARKEFETHLLMGNFDGARRALDRMPMDPVGPDCWSGRRCWRLWVDIPSGRLDAAEDNLKLLDLNDPKLFWEWLAIERGQLDVARARYEPSSMTMGNFPLLWLPLDVVLSGDTSRTLDEIENPTHHQSILWIMRLPFQDRWISEHGAPAFKEAFAALREEPRYQQALRKYGIDDKSLAEIQVHTDGLWD